MKNEIKFRPKKVKKKKKSEKKRLKICKKKKKKNTKLVPEFFSLTYVTTVTDSVIFLWSGCVVKIDEK